MAYRKKNIYGARGYTQAWWNARESVAFKLKDALPKISRYAVRDINGLLRDVTNGQVFFKDVPFYTGNLMDSTGFVMYEKGRIIGNHIPPRHAITNQRYQKQKRIWGYRQWQMMVKEGTLKYTKGINICLISAVPYASAVNNGELPHLKFSSIGYMDRLENMFHKLLYSYIELNKANWCRKMKV